MEKENKEKLVEELKQRLFGKLVSELDLNLFALETVRLDYDPDIPHYIVIVRFFSQSLSWTILSQITLTCLDMAKELEIDIAPMSLRHVLDRDEDGKSVNILEVTIGEI